MIVLYGYKEIIKTGTGTTDYLIFTARCNPSDLMEVDELL